MSTRGCVVISVSLTLAGCGFDAGGAGDDVAVDAATSDGRGDGGQLGGLAATIAVTDVRVTTPGGAAAGVRGGAISVEFSDLSTGGGDVLYGVDPIGDCVVTRYAVDGTSTPHPRVNGGTVTISNPGSEQSGLLKPVGPCELAQSAGYLCSSHGGAASNVTVSPGGDGTATYILSDADFTGVDLEGAYLQVNGLVNASNNSRESAFPIVRQFGVKGNNLVVSNPTLAGEILASGATFAIRNGAGPVPTGFGGDADFLGLSVDQIRISKPATDAWGAIDFTTYTRGENFDLDYGSDEAHQFPVAGGTAMQFSCAGVDGDCGSEGDETLEAIVVSGRTTDGPIPGGDYPEYLMPDPVTEYAEFQCAYLLSDTATIPAAAVDAILSTDPTRVEVRVLRVAGTTLEDGELNHGQILIGHGVVGHTTLP